MKAAQKEVAEARRQARNERRKKQRLIKKAANLSAEDLERIAVLKRCGLADRLQSSSEDGSAQRVDPASSSAGSAGMPATTPETGTLAGQGSSEPRSPTARASDAEADRS